MCVGKIKNTEGSAMSVGSVAVQLQYGLYVVGHLSKLAFHFMFKVVRLVVVVSSFRLACNDFRLGGSGGKLAISNLESTTLQLFTTVFRKHLARHFAKPMLAVVLFSICNMVESIFNYFSIFNNFIFIF
jgi:hypothetical protein